MKNIFYSFFAVIVLTNISNSQTIIDSIEVSTGWNLIGALTTGDIPSIISTIPPYIITSSFYGFNPGGSYFEADTLNQGKGYWVKVSQNGIILIESTTTDPCQGLLTVFYEGKTYNTLQIGTQCWLRENLNVGTRIDGIQNMNNNSIVEKYCYNNDSINCLIYGGLYQWDEAMQYVTTSGAQGICPPGWHIPTLIEFQTLKTNVNDDGNALKHIGQGTGGGAGTNTSGFSALLAGYHNNNGNFGNLGVNTYFWSSTEYDANNARYLNVYYLDNIIYLDQYFKNFGYSIRCFKD